MVDQPPEKRGPPYLNLQIKLTMLKPVHTLVVRDWKEDVVQLVQFPRTHTIISPSPFALKLETFLRMNNIKYHNVSNDFTKASAKGQSPFIELNGRQFPDSGMCIEHLHSHFKLSIDNHLSANERAQLRAFNMLIEESLFRCLQCDRSKDYGWLASDKGYAPLLPSVQKFLFQKLLIKQLQSRLKKTCVGQGYGRHTQEEIDDIAKKDLMAISTFLGEKPFFFGDNPTTLDATLFGHLVQFTDAPLKTDAIKPFIETSTPNLVAYVQRMKERYWPDWAEILEHLALNPEDLEKSKEAAAAATVAGENGAKVTDQPQQAQG
uniref:Failed axon connections fax protein/glutathione s-transferase-like protein n=1 Tax=Globodera pallida TaxID=36090 RepID=A0A183BV15_GLOPA